MRTATTDRRRCRKPAGFISYLTRLMDMLEEKQQQTGNRNQSNYQSQKGGVR